MPPPDLPRDTPVPDIIHPLKICLGPGIGNDPGVTCLDRGNGLLRQWFDPDKQLFGEIRFYGCSTPVAMSNTVLVRFCLLQEALLPEGFKNFLSTFKPIFALEAARLFIHEAIAAYYFDGVKAMALAYFKVMGIMGRRNLQGTGPKSRVHILVKDERNRPVHQREYHSLPFQTAIAVIRRVYRHSRIPEHGLRTRGGHNNPSFFAFKRISDVIKMPVVVFMIHF